MDRGGGGCEEGDDGGRGERGVRVTFFLIPVDGFFIYFSTYIYYTVVLTPRFIIGEVHM